MATSRRRNRPGALLLTPGAGADRNHHTLLAVAGAVDPLPCERVDFPRRKAGKQGVDRPPVAIASLVADAEALVKRTGITANQLILGGRSFGGRMCSMAVADGLPAAGLVLLSYPLHPPGKPDRMRTEHFSALDLPCLCISGDRDPFGNPDEFAEAIKAIPGPVSQVWLPGGHDPRNVDDAIGEAVRDWIDSLTPR